MEGDCGVCMENYDKHSKKPRFLSCGHKFCEACLHELLLTKGPAITCPNCRKVTNDVYDITCLPAAAEQERSQNTLKSGNSLEEQAQSLQREAATLHSLLADYDGYLKKVQQTNVEASLALRLNYEQQFDRLSGLTHRLLQVLEDHKTRLNSRLMSCMLHKQQQLVREDKDIQERLVALSNIGHSALAVRLEAAKLAEEQKLPSEDEAQLKKLQEMYFALMSELEKALKFKPTADITKQELHVDPKAAASVLDAFVIAEPQVQSLHNEQEVTHALLPLFEKMQQVKHPTVTFFSRLAASSASGFPLCTILSYNIITGAFVKDDIPLPLDLNVKECEAVAHPNGSSIYLVMGGIIVLYDCLNRIFLKKPSNTSTGAMKGCAVAYLDNCIYVMGGMNSHQALSTTYRYHVVSDKWTPLSALNVDRCYATACAVNEYQICIAGGENEAEALLDSLELLNVQTNVWDLCAVTMKIPRKHFNIASLEKDRLIICGGENPAGVLGLLAYSAFMDSCCDTLSEQKVLRVVCSAPCSSFLLFRENMASPI